MYKNPSNTEVALAQEEVSEQQRFGFQSVQVLQSMTSDISIFLVSRLFMVVHAVWVLQAVT